MQSIHASEQPMTRRRRRQDARWSASFSLTIVNGSVRTPIAVDVCDADLESLLKGLVGRAQFRFRFNGKSRAYSVPLVNGTDEAVAFRNLLRVVLTEVETPHLPPIQSTSLTGPAQHGRSWAWKRTTVQLHAAATSSSLFPLFENSHEHPAQIPLGSPTSHARSKQPPSDAKGLRANRRPAVRTDTSNQTGSSGKQEAFFGSIGVAVAESPRAQWRRSR